ncbi:hypothetical protein MTR67_052258 [Solanum verrucosum]|uniref:Uncharacterized protein n=1 Tax=Solanum verrucosum TaxID=315347 RepID=A0AAF0V8X7_SOLVR|nr:hypothetical protein MTR67_052258 [Solanum verrucosum]
MLILVTSICVIK